MEVMETMIKIMQKLGMVTEHPQVRILHPLNWIIWPPILFVKIGISMAESWLKIAKEVRNCMKTEFCWWK